MLGTILLLFENTNITFLLQRSILDQGWSSCSLHWQVDSLPPDHQGSPGNCL